VKLAGKSESSDYLKVFKIIMNNLAIQLLSLYIQSIDSLTKGKDKIK